MQMERSVAVLNLLTFVVSVCYFFCFIAKTCMTYERKTLVRKQKHRVWIKTSRFFEMISTHIIFELVCPQKRGKRTETRAISHAWNQDCSWLFTFNNSSWKIAQNFTLVVWVKISIYINIYIALLILFSCFNVWKTANLSKCTSW